MRARRPALASVVTAAGLALALASGPGARAQDPVADAFCALFTTAEVGGALGTEVAAEPSLESCAWFSTATDSFSSASAGWAFGSLDEQKAVWPGGDDIDVGGQPAYFSPDAGVLFLEVGPGVLMLMAFGSEVDVEDALTDLGELAVGRAASLLPPADVPPAGGTDAEMHADPDLEALFPEMVGGVMLEVESTAGPDLMASAEPEEVEAIEAILAAQGRSIDDISAAFAFSMDAGTTILAYRLAGGDATAFRPLIVESLLGDVDVIESPGTLAGREVSVFTGDDQPIYLYGSGEILWVVAAPEAVAEEIVAALP